MTVCVAAACEGGKNVVCATDGQLSFAGISADVMFSKMYWINEWLFMYAGEPSQSKMIFEEAYFVAEELGGLVLDRKNVQQIVNDAYQRRRAKMSSEPILGPLRMTLEEFKANGLAIFGEAEFGRIVRDIQDKASLFAEELLVVGWGHAECACMIYTIGPWGDCDHALDGISAIGSGAEIALSSLLLLGHSRDSALPETLYAVAAAKFSAETSKEQTVGTATQMYVCEKSTSPRTSAGKFVQQAEIQRLRKLWEDYGRPRIPFQANNELVSITKKIGYEARVSAKLMAFISECVAKSSSEGD
jgi:hypothetical protein